MVKQKLMFTPSSFATSRTVNHWSECSKAMILLIFSSVSEVDSQLEHCSSYHDFFYHFLELRLVDISVVTVTSVFPHCNIYIGNLAFAIPACMYFVPNYWLTFNRQMGHYLIKCTPFSSKRGRLFHSSHLNWIVLWLQQKTVT